MTNPDNSQMMSRSQSRKPNAENRLATGSTESAGIEFIVEGRKRPGLSADARTLLVIEEDLAERELYRRLLTEQRPDDFIIVATDSVAQGIDLYQSLNPDCVILAYNLPDFNGLEFLDRLGKIHDSDCLPVIMITGLGNESVAVEAMKRGAQDYIDKRVLTPHLLRSAVQSAIDKVALRNHVKELHHAKSDFLSTASHELRTPLTIIREYIGIVRDGVTGPVTPEQVDGLDTALNNCDRLSTLINDLLELQRLESGAQRLHRRDVDLDTVLSRCVHDFLPVCQKKSQTCSLELAPGLPHALCDADAVTQVVINLVANACKFTPDGGLITVRAMVDSDDAELLRIEVSDNGPGIRLEDQALIFEKFTQVDRQPTPGTTGTGLGLAIVKRIVNLHDGAITLKSTPGVSTTFSFTLPAYTEPNHLVALISDSRWAARALNSELCVTLVRLMADARNLPVAAKTDQNVLLPKIEIEIGRAMSRKTDVTLILPSECAIVISTEVEDGEGMEAVRRRISNAVLGVIGDRQSIQLASGIVHANAHVKDFLKALRQQYRTLDATRMRRRLLLVNRNASTSFDLNKSFSQGGSDLIVVGAKNGYEACLRFGSLEPDLVILDAASCDGNVEQLLLHLRAAAPERNLKTIVTSVSSEQHMRLSELGATAVLEGQLDIQRVKGWVSRLLELKTETVEKEADTSEETMSHSEGGERVKR